MSDAAKRQDMPTGDGEVVLFRLTEYIDRVKAAKPEWYDMAALARVQGDLTLRAEMGREKYGTYLRVNNGRNVRLDLYQEVMDALMYSEQLVMEGDRDCGRFLDQLLNMAQFLVTRL